LFLTAGGTTVKERWQPNLLNPGIFMIDETIRSETYPSITKLARKADINDRTVKRGLEYLRDIHQAPVDFKTEEYFNKEMGVWASSCTPYTVELLIDNEIGTFALERQWPDSQIVEQREDGSVYVKFTTTQMPEVLRWVLRQGHTVKVLGLAELVKEEVEKVIGMYEG
jgi:hypothetical protein